MPPVVAFPVRDNTATASRQTRSRGLGAPHLHGHGVEVGEELLAGDPGFGRSVGGAEGAEHEKPPLVVRGALGPLLLTDAQVTVVRAAHRAASVDVLHAHSPESTCPARSEVSPLALYSPNLVEGPRVEVQKSQMAK